MPRPRVKPEDRLRAMRACGPCKRSKVRCDAGTPCTKCQNRGIESLCSYQESRIRRPNPEPAGSPASQDANGVSTTPNPVQHPYEGDETTPELVNDNDDRPPPCEDAEGPRSRTLLSSSLQRVYVGETASLSYLDFLRGVIRNHLGPCTFTENGFSQYMLEKDIRSTGDDAFMCPTAHEMSALSHCFLDATNGILNLYGRTDILSAIDHLGNTPASVPEASLYLILAIGAQCRGASPLDAQMSTDFFARARALTFEGMLCDPSLEMISNFILMAYFLLGACHRNGAFMYLGVASKAASALGLHKADQYRSVPQEECVRRLKIWKSLCVLDMIVNSILGRHSHPNATVHEERTLRDFEQSLSTTPNVRTKSLQAIFDLCPLMHELELSASTHEVASAEAALQRLREWSRSLPKEFREHTTTDLGAISIPNHEVQAGRVNVACSYYFAVILVTRHFMTASLLSHSRRRTSFSASSPTEDGSSDSGAATLTHVCINAAISLAKVAQSSIDSDSVTSNMCLLKAWTFSAGLVLGFALFFQPVGLDPETEEAFFNTIAVEQRLSELSSQAGHYCEILSSLGEAITMHKRKSSDDRKRVVSRYLDPVFVSDSSAGAGAGTRARSYSNISTLNPFAGILSP